MERANEAKEWMESAKEWFDQEDGAKTEREEEAERDRLAQEAEEAYARDRQIWKLESKLGDLQGEIDALSTEIETFQGMYDALTEEEIEAGEGADWLTSIQEYEE